MWAHFSQCKDKENLVKQQQQQKEEALDLGLEMTLQKISWKYMLIIFYFKYFLCPLTSNDIFSYMSFPVSSYSLLLPLWK